MYNKLCISVNKYSFLAIIFILCSCTGNRSYTPKPRGFLRIELPVAQYLPICETDLFYEFSVSQQVIIELPPTGSTEYWMNIDYPGLNAKIYCSYKQITTQTLDEHIQDFIDLTERVAMNASTIKEKAYENRVNNVYGILFQIEGEVASPIQFILTDSVSHFFRGALYFKNIYNHDSIAPVTEYIMNDITEFIQSFHWKN